MFGSPEVSLVTGSPVVRPDVVLSGPVVPGHSVSSAQLGPDEALVAVAVVVGLLESAVSPVVVTSEVGPGALAIVPADRPDEFPGSPHAIVAVMPRTRASAIRRAMIRHDNRAPRRAA